MKGKTAIVVFGVLSVIILVFVLGSTFSEKKVDVFVSKEYRDVRIVDSLNSPHFWNRWVWNYEDKSAKIEYLDIKKGKGAGVVRKSSLTGKSGFKIMESSSDSLVYELVTDDQRFVERGTMYFKYSEDKLYVKWYNEIDFTRNVLARYKSYWSDYKTTFEKYQLNQLEVLDSLVYEKTE